MKKLLLLLFLPFILLGQTPIQDVLLNPTDTTVSTVSGTLTIVSNAIDVNGTQVVKTLTPVKIVAGVINITLAPNDTANSLNSYYTANYSINQVGNPKVTTNYSEKWQVPTSVTPLTIHQIKVNTTISSPVAPVLVNQLVTSPATDGHPWNNVLATPSSTVGNLTLRSLSLNDFPPIVSPTVATAKLSSWTLQSLPQTGSWGGIAYSPELGRIVVTNFVVGGAMTRIATSDDGGLTWTARTTPDDTVQPHAIVWSPKLHIFTALPHMNTGSFPGPALYSYDGITWTKTMNSISATNWDGIAWAPEKSLFCAVEGSFLHNPNTQYSTDGINWIGGGFTGNSMERVVWSRELGLFVAPGSNSNFVFTSPDCVTWASHATPMAGNRIAWSPSLGLFLVILKGGSNYMTSPDAITWTIHTMTNVSSWWALAWSPQLGAFAVADGNDASGYIATSTDGINWTQQPPIAGGNTWDDMMWLPEYGKFLGVAYPSSSHVLESVPMGASSLSPQQSSSGGSTVTLQTNGINNTSQSTINFLNSNAFNGLTLGVSNPTSGNVQLGVSGTLNNSGLTNSSFNATCPSWLTCSSSTSLGGTLTVSAAGGFSPENTTNKDIANGYAGLDSSGLLNLSEWPIGAPTYITHAATNASVLNEVVSLGGGIYGPWSSSTNTLPTGVCVRNCSSSSGVEVIQVSGSVSVVVDTAVSNGVLLTPSTTNAGQLSNTYSTTNPNLIPPGVPIIAQYFGGALSAGLITVSLRTATYLNPGVRFPVALASLPATCIQGTTQMVTDAPAGQNLYVCTATNTWSAPSVAATNITGTISAAQLPTALSSSTSVNGTAIPASATLMSSASLTSSSGVNLPNPKLIAGSDLLVSNQNLPSGTTTLYTVPSNRKALLTFSNYYNNTAGNLTIVANYVHSGTTYALSAAQTVTANQGTNSSGTQCCQFVMDAGDSFSVTTNGIGLTIFPCIIEFDSTSGLVSPKTFSLTASADNVLYQVPSGKRAYPVLMGVTSLSASIALTPGSTGGVAGLNTSGVSITYTMNCVPNGSASSGATRLGVATTTTNSSTLNTRSCAMSNQDQLIMNVTAGSGTVFIAPTFIELTQ